MFACFLSSVNFSFSVSVEQDKYIMDQNIDGRLPDNENISLVALV